MWAKHYFPSKLNYEPIFTILHTLKKSCKSKLDHEVVDSCISLFEEHFEACKINLYFILLDTNMFYTWLMLQLLMMMSGTI